MEASKWSAMLLNLGEEKITQLVNLVLSKSYGGCENKQLWIEDHLADLDLPSREDLEELQGKIESLNGKVDQLTVRLEELGKNPGKGKGAPTKKKSTGEG